MQHSGFLLCVCVYERLSIEHRERRECAAPKNLLCTGRPPNVMFQQKKIFSDDHLVSLFRVSLQASSRTHSAEEPYVDYKKTEFAGPLDSDDLL